jgi:hypothetical protein
MRDVSYSSLFISERCPTMYRYKRDALVYEPSEKVVKEVTAYGIASVFTPEQNRRRGYAQHMMRLLHWVLGNASFQASHSFPATWGAPPSGPADGAFSVLYSDIGPNFYYQAGEGDAQDSGWRVVGPASSVIPVPREHLSVNDAGEWRALDLPQSEALWADDASLMKKDLEDAGRSHSDHAIIAFLPTRGVAATQALRTMDPTTGELPFTKWGVRLEEQGKLSTTWATWGFELKGNPPSLVVTRMRAPDVPSFECLVQQLLRAAAEADVTQVEVWNLASEFRGAVVAVGGRTYERDDHLPSIKFYGGVDAEHVQFVFNEKWVLCLVSFVARGHDAERHHRFCWC